jgi:hypothetical protein
LFVFHVLIVLSQAAALQFGALALKIFVHSHAVLIDFVLMLLLVSQSFLGL